MPVRLAKSQEKTVPRSWRRLRLGRITSDLLADPPPSPAAPAGQAAHGDGPAKPGNVGAIAPSAADVPVATNTAAARCIRCDRGLIAVAPEPPERPPEPLWTTQGCLRTGIGDR